MIVNFRYHVFTITAIFAALGLGILIGSSIIGTEGVVEEQKKIIEDIGVNLRRLRTENYQLEGNLKKLKSELDYRTELEQRFFSLTMNKMSGEERVYYLISDENLTGSFKDKLRNIFSGAGAEIKFPDSLQNLKESNEFNKIILWRMDEKEEDLKIDPERVLRYNEIVPDYNLTSNFMGLILAILESELDEIGK